MPLLPPLRESDQRSLGRALDLAEEAAAEASPNPTVGCVLTREGELLGEGAHRYTHRDHAEIVALKQASALGHNVRGATACVTLEPCSHHGRTGPCADALITAGIAHCLVATVDPNPLVRGQGIARLRAAGVEVSVLDPSDSLAQRARRLNDAFAFSIQHGRPFVTLKAALSRDGKLAPGPGERKARAPFWLTGPAARTEVQQLRHYADALLTGVGTVLADDPHLSDRTGLTRRRPLLRVVLDTHLRTPEDAVVVRDADHDLLLISGEDASQERRRALERYRLEVMTLPPLQGPAALALVLEQLQIRGLRSILTEAGASLNGALLRAQLVDKVILYQADCELGSDALPFATEAVSASALTAQLTAVSRQTFPHGQTLDVRVAGYLHDPWAGV